MKKHDRGVVTQFLANFPQVKGNVGLVSFITICFTFSIFNFQIHQAYISNTKTRRSEISILSTQFRDLVPAINQMASTILKIPLVEQLSLSK